MAETTAAKEVLFEVTSDHLETGMRGFPVGYCTTSSVDAQKGLYYVGQPVSELAEKRPEEVIYLLYYGHHGSSAELKAFTDDLERRAPLSPKTIECVRSLPREGHPMALLSASVMILGMLEGTGDYQEDCLNLIAKMPEPTARVINYHAGWPESGKAQPELGYIENFCQLLNAPNVDLKDLTEVMSLFNVLHYDHGGGNLSTFVGKAVASGLADLYGSIAAALNALAGPRHGKANQDCLVFVQEVLKTLGPDATQDQVADLIRRKLQNKELVFGFGHAVLRVEDPRATVLYQVAKQRYAADPLVRIALLLRSAGPQELSKKESISNPYPNVDAISGTVLTAAGFPYPEYYTVLFGLSRSVGIARQIVYERNEARNGKGTPIVRPRYFYKADA